MAWGLLASEQTLAKNPQKRLLTAFNRLGGILYHPISNNLLKRIIMNTKQFLLESSFAGLSRFSRPRNERIDSCKSRILRAIKHGNHEPKYIVEYVTAGSIRNLAYEFVIGEAINELKREGKIKYNELLEGYYLSNE